MGRRMSCQRVRYRYFCFQRAEAASLAISLRWSGVSREGLTTPPLRPPLRPRATAWGFLRRLRAFLGVKEPPIAVSTTRKAFLMGSESLLERFGMMEKAWHR